MTKDVVILTAEERDAWTGLLAAGRTAAPKVAHARIPPKADAADGRPGRTDDRTAEAVEVRTDTVGRVRQRGVESGAAPAPTRKTQDDPRRERVPDGAAEARLITLACSPPPDERTRWTPRMPADGPVESEVVPAVSAETVRRVTKKTWPSRTWRSRGAGPPARAGSSWPGWRT